MTLHSEIWQRSVIGLSAEQIAADLSETIDRVIVVSDKVAFVTACLANVQRNPNLALHYTPLPWEDPYVPPPPERMSSIEERHREMEERYFDGETVEQIADAFGLVPQTIIYHLRRRGVWINTPAPVGVPYCPVEELATKQAAWERSQAILRAKSTGVTVASLGRAIGRSRERARQIIRKAERQEGKPSPLEKWMADKSYLREIAEKLNLISPLAERAPAPE